jgi:hypothetical protein
MQLDDAQRQKVSAWLAEELKLSDIQKRLDTELGIRMTYLEVRLLLDDLRLTPKDIERSKPAVLAGPAKPNQPAAAAPSPPLAAALEESLDEGELAPAGSGKVNVVVDQLARPGALVSGKVTFSDGKTAEWYLDQTGRLGLVPKDHGYKPSPMDVQEFQMALELEMRKMGF